jgi:hypothetical protein
MQKIFCDKCGEEMANSVTAATQITYFKGNVGYQWIKNLCVSCTEKFEKFFGCEKLKAEEDTE